MWKEMIVVNFQGEMLPPNLVFCRLNLRRMKPIAFCTSLLISLCLFSCSAAESEKNVQNSPPEPAKSAPARPDFNTGTILDDEAGYAIYLPTSYKAEQSWPIVYFFDAHARAHLPLEKYQSLAEAMGWVLAASALSENGQNPAQSIDISSSMMRDLQQKLNVDPRRQYTAGFSGGARVAALVAQNRTDIAGVIGCGAGFQPAASDRFHFVGMVGMEDFNYQEIRSLEQYLHNSGGSHLVEYFDGGHDWAPLNTMAKGLRWLYFREMATGLVPKSDTAAVGMLEKVRYQDEQLKTRGNDYQRWLLHKKAISYLKDIIDISELQAQKDALRLTKGWQHEFEKQEQNMQREMEMRKQYSASLGSESIDYWKRVTTMMNKVGRNGTRDDAWLNKRVLNFLSLSAYMNANGALQAGALPAADRFVKIYALVDPSNSEHAYLRATIQMKESRPDAAVQSLSQAFSLGFEDADRLEKDPVFAPLHGQAAFTDLLTSVRNK